MSDRSQTTPFVVGVGVATCRQDALQNFVAALGDTPGVAIVLVPLRDPGVRPLQPTMLQKHTSAPVIEVVSREKLTAGCIFACRPHSFLELRGDDLVVIDQDHADGESNPIDHFFRSLARQRGESSAGVLLVASSGQGRLGLKAIGDAGGHTFADDSESVTAAMADVADSILPAANIASVIHQHASNWMKIAQLRRELAAVRADLETTTQALQKQSADAGQSLARTVSTPTPVAPPESDPTYLLDSTNIATLFLDNERKIRSFTPGVTALYQLSPADIGFPLQAVKHVAVEMPAYPDDVSLDSHSSIEDEIETQDGRWFLRRVQPYADATHGRGGLVVTFYEITEQHRLRMRLAAAHAVTKLLADADSFETVIPKVLRALRVSLSAEACLLWRIDADAEFLTCVEADASDSSLQPFVDLSRQTRFALGEGLPGQAWRDREPVWFEDIQNKKGFLRAAAAKQSGLASGVGTPIVVGRKFKGVIEIYTTRKLTREPELLQLLGAVGNEIGQFIRQRRLTDTIRDEEARKTAILRSALDCIITMDTAGRIVDFNPAAERTFGHAASDVVGRRLSDVIIPEAFREAHRNGLTRFLDTGASDLLGRRVELTAERADGRLFPVEVAISVSHGRDGSPFFTGYLRDITDRKLADATLLERAELAALHASLAVSLAGEAPLSEILNTCCQRIVDGLDAAHAHVWLLDEQDAMLERTANAGIDTHLDGPQRRVPLGKSKIGQIAATQQPLLTNDLPDAPDAGDPPSANWEGMEGFAGFPLVVEHRVVGVFALFTRHSLAQAVFEQLIPMADAMAQCIARKESEQRLLDREQRLNLALDAGRLGTWHWDIKNDRVTWSDQLFEIFGYAHDQFSGTRAGFLDIIHPDDRASVVEQLESIFTGTCESYEMDFRVIRGDDGRAIWTSGRGFIDRDELNRPLSITAVASDITDRKVDELNLAFLSDLQTRLVPLTSVDELMAISTRLTANYLGLTRCLLVEFDQRGETADILCDHHIGDGPSMVGKHSVRDFHDDAERSILIAGNQVLSDDAQSPRREARLVKSFHTFNIGAFCNSAYVTDRGTKFVVSALYDESHHWQPDERRLLQEVADRVGIRIERARSEEELANREAHLRRVINNQLGLVGVVDRNGILLEVDDRSLKIARTRREDVIGKPFDEAPWWSYDPAVAARMRDAMRRAMAGEVVRYDVSLFAPGDEGVMIDFMIAPVTDDHGEVEFLIPSGVDIRDRYRAQQQLMENERRVSMALRAGRMAAWEWTPEKSHWDSKLFELLGIAPIADPSPETLFEYVHPDDLSTLQSSWKRATAGEGDFDVEFRVRLPNGGIRWLAAVGTVIRSPDGSVVAMHGLNWDITEQKESQQRIRDSEQRFRNMANAAPAMIWVSDQSHQCTFLSQRWCDFTGQSEREGLGTGWIEAVHPDDRQSTRQAFLTAVDRHEPFELDFRLRAADDSYRWAIDAGQPRFDESGGFVGYVGSVIDAHDRHEAQSALQEARAVAVAANESKSAFLANMSHEIRTPMTAILGYADLLGDLTDNEEAKQHLQTIRRNGDYLLEIINDILDLSKIEAGKLDVQYDNFDPHRLIEDVRSIMEVRASEENLTLNVQYQGKTPRLIHSDAKRLKQILINLVGNAIKFTRQGGVQIRVRFESSSQQLLLDVIDTGIGIPDEQLEKLFKPFSQGDASVTRNFGGTGLGLAISQRLAETLGGSITVNSTVGVGSTFTVSIDTGNIATSDLVDYSNLETDDATETTTAEGAITRLPWHVLVVDDRRDIRFLSKHILTQSGATVDECEDGLHAVNYITACMAGGDCPDLILLDMQMPNLDGYSTAAKLRTLGYTGPIIALTADAMQGDMNKCLEAGCNDYLSKPIDKALMLEKVAAFMKTSAKPSLDHP
ncbi:Aerobic respiration control sensor protein ArcB [Stieleria neptunia]|uniref:histidine kinase n=1 Tax=Stieleria neptunia TaxID=2527979 RepID=A0A518HHZ9_9BACT|nr:PAS domain S-box protein [Stieleria neptunia]QDV40478.1 Aerobic respiration control sensor protein ArcB [Stieleria neptunia]